MQLSLSWLAILAQLQMVIVFWVPMWPNNQELQNVLRERAKRR